MNGRSAHRAGFSLLELIIVVTLLGILSAGVVPVFQGTFSSIESEHAVRDLIATIRYAQERAVTDSIEYRLYLEPDNNEYWVAHLAGYDEDDREKVFETIEARGSETALLPSRVEMRRPRARKDRDAGAYYIAFYPNGACDDAKITLEREREAGGNVYIETRGGMGRLRVKQ